MPRPRAIVPAGRATAGRPRLPIHARCHALQHLDAAGIVEALQAERQGIGAGGGGELVDEALHREGIADLAGRPDVRGPERRVLQPVRDHAHVRHGISGIGVLGDEAGGETLGLLQAGGRRRQQRNIGQALGGLRESTSPPARRISGRCRRGSHAGREAAADPWDPSHARPPASIGRAPAAPPPATTAPRRRRHPHGRSCHSNRRRRDRSGAPSPPAGRGTSRNAAGTCGSPARRSRSSRRHRATSATAQEGPSEAWLCGGQ